MQTFSRYWRERERRLLGEEFSKVYRYPSSPKTKMYDFYVLSYVGDLVERSEMYAPRGHMIRLGDDVKTAATDARDTIVRGLAAEMEEDVFQSIATEMQHASMAVDNMVDNMIDSRYVEVGPNKRIYLWQALKGTIKRGKDGRITFKYKNAEDVDDPKEYSATDLKVQSAFGTNVKQMRADAEWLRGIYEDIVPEEEWGSHFENDYKKVRERVGAERERFVRLAEKVFGDHRLFWGEDYATRVEEGNATEYAGAPWVAIARGWLKLKAARGSVRDQAVQIDHIYDLQHNNGSVFDKLSKYDMGEGYEWLAEVLDYKRDARSYYELITNFVTGERLVSSDCKVIALRAMYAVTGQTEEGAKKRAKEGDEKAQQETNGYKKTINGNTMYYKDKAMKVLHREDGPAVVSADGTKEWYLDGKRHREDGPAVVSADGKNKEWYLNGQPHREDGPAFEWANGTKSWWLNGQLHREDGPAYEYADGSKFWYLNGQSFSSEKEWKKRMRKKSK